MRLQETIKKILREGLDDKWTRDNQTVTLKELLDIVKDIPTSNIPTKKLIKHALHGDNTDELKSIENDNLKYPILILSNDNGTIKYIVDGHHRIQKASKYKIPTVSAKLIKFSELPKKFREVLGGDKEEESEGVGAYAAPAFEMMPDHEHFKHLYEEDNDKKNTWKEVNGKLIKKYKFSDYDETVNFVNKVEKIAKKQNHHPDITFGFDNVKVTITDHEKGGISNKCYKFTKEVDKL